MGAGHPREQEYDWCHKFATAAIVGNNTHYIVDVCPLGSFEYADTEVYSGKDRSYYAGDVVRRLLSIADDYVNIDVVYADREFHAADVIHTLERKDLKYIIPAKKDKSRVGALCDRFDELKRGYDEEKDLPLHVASGFPMHGRVKFKTTKTKVRSSLVILPPDEDDEANKEGSPQPFLMNFEVSNQITLDRRRTRDKIEVYSDCGAIENSHSSMKEAAAWTTSKEFEVRWFHFAFGCIIYNLWLLVDFLTQDRIGVKAPKKKPRITLKEFLEKLENQVVRLV